MSVEEPTLTLFDLETLKGTLSPFVWRARLALNYKKLRYKTEWLTLVTIKPTYMKLGLPETPNPVEKPFYTVPALIDTSTAPHTLISESKGILKYVDEKFPEPPLYVVRSSGCSDAEWERKASLLVEVNDFLDNKTDPRWHVMFGFVIPATLGVIKEEDVTYFKESRIKWFQKPFEEIGHKVDVAEARLEDVKGALDTLEEIYQRAQRETFVVGKKPWLFGDTVSAADFAVVGWFLFIAGVTPHVWEKMRTWNSGRWGRMVELSAEWR